MRFLSNQVLLYTLAIAMCAINGLVYCSGKSEPKPPVHEQLIRFHSTWVYDMDDLAKMEARKYRKKFSVDFNPKTDTIRYERDRIYVSYLRAAAGCADYYGTIRFRGDTIELLFVNKSDVVCAETDIYRVVYEIDNKEGKKYTLQKY